MNHTILSRGTELNRLDRAKHPEAMKKMYIIWTQQQKCLLDYAEYFFISTGYQKRKKKGLLKAIHKHFDRKYLDIYNNG